MSVDGDWTWVLTRPCPDCQADVLGIERNDLGPRVRAVGASWRMLLGRGALVHKKQAEGDRTWSVLEYGCHVSDVFELFEERIQLALKKRTPPTFRDWDQNLAAVEGDYVNADPDHVAYQLATRAGKVADVLDRVSGDEWKNRAIRSDGVEFTVETLARYMLHDVEHHLWDARQILDS